MKAFMLLGLALASALLSQAGSAACRKPKALKVKASTPSSASSRQRAIAFIRQIKMRELAASEFILLDKPASFASNYCLNEVLTKKQFFSSAELTMLKVQAGDPRR